MGCVVSAAKKLNDLQAEVDAGLSSMKDIQEYRNYINVMFHYYSELETTEHGKQQWVVYEEPQ